MKPLTIHTDRRIFQVTEIDGETYLCNLEHLRVNFDRKLIAAENGRVKQIKHYWNTNLRVVAIKYAIEMIELAKR
jgi:hypothetical protein